MYSYDACVMFTPMTATTQFRLRAPRDISVGFCRGQFFHDVYSWFLRLPSSVSPYRPNHESRSLGTYRNDPSEIQSGLYFVSQLYNRRNTIIWETTIINHNIKYIMN